MTSACREPIADWAGLKTRLSQFGPAWVFRGHAGASWPLATALERADSADRAADEWRMIDHFRRRAALHLPPQLQLTDEDVFGWMALMQHYGAPTRLLDVTRSPYVAAFFALEEPECGDETDAAIWCIDTRACAAQAASAVEGHWGLAPDEAARMVTHEHGALVRRLVSPPGCCIPVVFPVEPWRFDPRQSAQQACFLCPGDVSRPIRGLLDAVPAPHGAPAIVQLTVPRATRTEALDDLWRMNVSPASLFPSLEGQARALRMLLTPRD
ncbi:hypothetical protein TBR22_A28890 [Luteitalea sp. TBR-22]|uniref:FRG domain-containing protein n=1 Tax=Luteitalea sp. TBR-22 TaxID=2802971 RepID=UPI001AF87526|nr:FRG domain-containing protein [Luteitalea sp. TBR-22]BCS33662.1 hypothetical protein TBR22_A28890 [Luteitalea sp. TBR-22]